MRYYRTPIDFEILKEKRRVEMIDLEKSIYENIDRIIWTPSGSLPYNPSFGSTLTRYFKVVPNSKKGKKVRWREQICRDIKESIQLSIEQNEPRLDEIEIFVMDATQGYEESISVTVRGRIIGERKPRVVYSGTFPI